MSGEKSIRRERGIWFVTAVLALVFLMAGTMKILAVDPLPDNYIKWGYPLWFLYVVGSIEILGAFVLVLRKYASLGALVLGGVMFGAFITHLVTAQWAALIAPVVLFGLLYWVGYERRDPILDMIGYKELRNAHNAHS